MKLPAGIRFSPGPGHKKYRAVWTSGGKRHMVTFGDRRYQQFRDSVPVRLGGGLYSHKDHRDPERRRLYRARHGKPARVYSAGWFSTHLLW